MAKLVTCIGCGCDDNHACITDFGDGCHWLVVDRKKAVGVCSACPKHLKRWKKGDRRLPADHAVVVRQLAIAVGWLGVHSDDNRCQRQVGQTSPEHPEAHSGDDLMASRRPRLTQERLKEVLDYNPTTGLFTWKIQTSHRIRAGDVASALSDEGYIRLSIDYRRYYAQRLAWLYMTGKWPREQIDHKNTIRTDNRWENLRAATNQFNNQNRRKAHRTNKTGLLGVRPYLKKFVARISSNGEEHHLGVFLTPELAHAAYVEAKRELHDGCTL